MQATPAPRKGKAVRTLLAMPATCHSVQLHTKQLSRGEGPIDNGPVVPGSYGVDIASGKSTSVVNAHSDISPWEYALYAGLEDIMAAALYDAEGDPKSLQEVRSHADWPSWKAAMDHEMEMLEKAVTWKPVICLPGKNIIGCKWVFRIKCKANGSIEKYKAWLIAHGFMQIHRVDYFETYSPIAKLASFHLILAIAACHGWEVHMFDFNGTYPNGELEGDKEIYKQQPLGYETGSPEKVMKLLKALYSLKQAGRRWYDILLHALKELGFTVSTADLGVFYACLGKELLILAMHVNDCAMTGSCMKLILEYKAKLNSHYPLTDLGPVHWLLSIKVTCDISVGTISLSQSTYIDSIISHFVLTDAKPYSTPMIPSASYSKDDSPSLQQDVAHMCKVPYHEAVGSLMYDSVATCPDITFAVSTLSQFLENLGEVHWEAMKHVFWYLSGAWHYALTYGGEKHDLVGYTDADRASQDHHWAISGHAFLIDGGAISWSSHKQELVTLSTVEAEYVAAMHAAKECIWLHHLIEELSPSPLSTTTLYYDNQAALKLATDDNYHMRTKHIDIHFHFICQVVASGAVDICYCPMDNMTANILTKALLHWKVVCHALGLGLHHASGGVLEIGGG